MEAKEYLANYSRQAEKFLDQYFNQKKKEAAKIDPLCLEMISIYRKYLQGGKMARGALTYLGYKCAGGRNKEAGLSASVAIEMLHGFILVHDDWIDKDNLRRGKPTVHLQYEKIFKQKKWKGDGKHWGGSMAIVLGDTGCFLAFKILADLPLPQENKTRAISYLSNCLIMTAYGEAMDITYDFLSEVSYRDVLSIRKLKTAYYTLVMPLATGAILGGASDNKVKTIEKYALPVGIAFQLRDDELGLFGREEILGKSTLADLLVGKKTLLILRAIENLSGKEKKFLLSVWGKDKINQGEIEKAKKLILKSGALDFSRKTAKNLVSKGKKFVPQITTSPELQDTLYNLADFMIMREK